MRTKPGWRTFVHGRVYRVDEFLSQTWGPDHHRAEALPPETLFRYHKPPGEPHGYFEQVVEPDNPLVGSEQAQKAVEELRRRGMSYRQIARLGGVSVEAVHRSASGVGRIRASTQEAILAVAASPNGKSRLHVKTQPPKAPAHRAELFLGDGPVEIHVGGRGIWQTVAAA